MVQYHSKKDPHAFRRPRISPRTTTPQLLRFPRFCLHAGLGLHPRRTRHLPVETGQRLPSSDIVQLNPAILTEIN